MKVNVFGIQEVEQRSCERVIQLFDQEATVQFLDSQNDGDVGQADITFTFTSSTMEKDVFIKGELIGEEGNVKLSDETTFSYEDNEQKRRKQAILYVLLSLLETHTGRVQPWGVLTGIRPTKRFHSMHRDRGLSFTEVRETLEKESLMRPEKSRLLESIVKQQLKVVPDLYDLNKAVSLYIGIPFCPTMCAYCTFPAYDINGKQGNVDAFLEGLFYEIKETGKWLRENGISVTTVYLGGGTPTSISASQMDRLYEVMYKEIPDMDSVREFTVEAGRPDTIDEEKIAVLNKWNVDRISVNPQSFHDQTLRAIGRHHSVQETIDKYNLAYEHGMTNINMDLIIGLPGEGLNEFNETLDVMARLMPTSVTVHTLSYKRASQMTKYKEKYHVADSEEIHAMMDEATVWMDEHGYEPYYLYRQKNILGNLENVGYAQPNQESIYNIMIMEEAQTIIGLGCGAASKFVDPETRNITRFANPKDPVSYQQGYQSYTEKKITLLDELFSSSDQGNSPQS
ncbi:coproporphyrinogen III oxidase [Texcoconibacillus texcoconensis]|uniref:Oxygen-independent coproporphyrinogen-3 oxidase n=1 Tax=Texcoconibacillus texcoconensis TaxID=1095777 RepID=A0A840QPF2_9BACI|nr:coproporphyrinogen III oxidase [Texcoconibacillus texcoconensis]MBB5173254.1 oxygen-independent coproporphyrinogen-3 oxidase [Texcoconibacillus texcoconensis]